MTDESYQRGYAEGMKEMERRVFDVLGEIYTLDDFEEFSAELAEQLNIYDEDPTQVPWAP